MINLLPTVWTFIMYKLLLTIIVGFMEMMWWMIFIHSCKQIYSQTIKYSVFVIKNHHLYTIVNERVQLLSKITLLNSVKFSVEMMEYYSIVMDSSYFYINVLYMYVLWKYACFVSEIAHTHIYVYLKSLPTNIQNGNSIQYYFPDILDNKQTIKGMLKVF